MIISYKGKTPKIGKNVFIAPTAAVIGDVEIRDGASIWYGVVVRGDMEPIVIGSGTNVQDNCTVHTDYGCPTRIGNDVSVGHNAVIHGCTIENDCLIGIGAVVLSGSKIMRNSVVAAGSTVRENQSVGPGHLVAGVPAKLKREISEDEIGGFLKPTADYKILAPAHAAHARTVEPG